ncbi:30S ribosomal protein S6 [Desulfobacterales bacterium HSG2]|nr:30S ribosomal protein S6 [Desulfobacterales bacterium HSG2]
MRRYETIVIIDPDLSNEERDPLYEKIRELIPRLKGFLVEFDEWGTQKLAYEIKKKTRGHYFRLDYCGTGDLVSEMERSFRIDDRVLKYMTVLLEKDTDVESFKKETEVAEEPPAEVEKPAEDVPEDSEIPEPETTDNETTPEESVEHKEEV